MKCIIIDDEPLAIKVIASHIGHINNLELVGCFENAMDGFAFLQQEAVDLIFLDIQMPKLTGLDFLKTLRNRPHVILCTAYRDYALDGFELDVVDYLVKPISFDRLLQAVGKCFRLQNQLAPVVPAPQAIAPQSAPAFIYVKAEREHVKILLDQILYLESIRNHVRIQTEEGSVITLRKISEMEEKLPVRHFLRVHRS
ncbi:MAG: DNA-binding response regulator, partial [Bacteroidota bacterium]